MEERSALAPTTAKDVTASACRSSFQSERRSAGALSRLNNTALEFPGQEGQTLPMEILGMIMNHRMRCRLKLAKTMLGTALVLTAANMSAVAQDNSKLPPIAIYEAMLDANRQSGWVQFRDFGGHQWIYFTALQTMHCRLKEIRYSLNSKTLDSNFPLVACNAQNPFAIPPDAGVDDIAIRLQPGAAQSIAVQVVWEDGRESDVVVYEPCRDVGEQSCASPLE